jgi:isopenicillin N synthase-like dioxygenase
MSKSSKNLGVALFVAAVATAGYFFYKNISDNKGKSEEEEDTFVKGDTLNLPVIELSKFLSRSGDGDEAYLAQCTRVAECFHKYGILVLRDPRVDEQDNNIFVDMMERYFGDSDGKRDARPEHHFQVGVTPEYTEKPVNHCHRYGSIGPDDKPLSICPPELDPKWRFFWRIGPMPKKTRFPDLNPEAVIPPEIPEWKSIMDMWGSKMLNALFALAEMTAVGFNMPSKTLTGMMDCGPHLLAPTGSDFNKFGQEGTVLAGYHYDLNFMTIHGKSRFPGLFVWTRDGKRLSVAIPTGCLLVQAGKQLEYVTGGHVQAGFHEVVCNAKTVAVINKKKAAEESLWRVSSTLFGHLQSDNILKPLPPFDTVDANAKYPSTYVGDQVAAELKLINLDQSEGKVTKDDK